MTGGTDDYISLGDYVMNMTCLGNGTPGDQKQACQAVLADVTETFVQSSGGDFEDQPEMIFLFEFREPVKLHHIQIEELQSHTRPNKIKIFQGKKSMGFSNVDEPGEEFILNDAFYNKGNKFLETKYAKWQNCWDVQVHVASNDRWDKNNDPDADDYDEDIHLPTEIKTIKFFGQTCQVLDQSKWEKPKG